MKKSDKLPAFQFYPSDHKKDPGVRALPIMHRLVWDELLWIMHDCRPRGYLAVDKEPLTTAELSRMIGGVTEEQVQEAIDNIMRLNVASQDGRRRIFNRRMVRDEAKRKQAKVDGASGGNPALTDRYGEPGFVYAVERVDWKIKIGIAKNVRNRIYKLRYKLGERLVLLATMPVQNMGQAEADLHRKYKQCKAIDGWFELNPAAKAELISTLKGDGKAEAKEDTRASSSSSSSSSESSSETISSDLKNKKEYGKEHGHVRLTDRDHELLVIRFGVEGTKARIEELDTYIAKIGVKAANKRYKCHRATIVSWENKPDATNKNGRSGTQAHRRADFAGDDRYKSAYRR